MQTPSFLLSALPQSPSRDKSASDEERADSSLDLHPTAAVVVIELALTFSLLVGHLSLAGATPKSDGDGERARSQVVQQSTGTASVHDGDTQSVSGEPARPPIGAATLRMKAKVKWIRKLSDPRGGLRVSRRSGRLVARNVLDTEVALLDMSGKEARSISGKAEGFIADGKRVVGSFGIRDIEREVIVSTISFPRTKYETLAISEESDFIAVLPYYLLGYAPYRPYLRVYGKDGELIRDFSDQMAVVVGEDVLGSQYYGALVPPNRLAIYLLQQTGTQLLLFDIPAGKLLWDVRSAGTGLSYNGMFSSGDQLFLSVLSKAREDGKWRVAQETCAYSISSGQQQWCRRGNFMGTTLSKTGRHLVTVISSGKHSSSGMPLYQTWRTQLIHANDGQLEWERAFFGEPLFVSEEGEYIVALDREVLRFLSLDGVTKYEFDLPGVLVNDTSLLWRQTATFDERNQTLVAVTSEGSIVCVSLAPEP